MTDPAQKLGNATAAIAIAMFLSLLLALPVMLVVSCAVWGECP